MSSHTPIMGAAMREMENAFVAVPSTTCPPRWLVSPTSFEPRRSSLVSWTVRLAQVADRIMAHAFPTTGMVHHRDDGLVEKTLNGLDRCCRLIPAHQGVVAAERVQLQIQQVLETRRERFERFQQLRRHGQVSRNMLPHPGSYLHLNPICRWIRFGNETDAGQQEWMSGSVLFFLADGQVHGLRMDLEGQVLVNELADYQPCTLLQWAELSSLANAQQLETLVRQLIDVGLVACSRSLAAGRLESEG